MTTFDRIKNLAKKRGLSLQQVAKKSEIGTNTIYKWKNYDPKGSDLAKVANVLHTTTDYLLGREDNHSDGLTWQDLDMPYGGEIPKDLKGYYRAIAEQYVKEHPDKFKKWSNG